jgi:hypothetical protein
LKQALKDQTDCNVLVTILTDGAENASKEYSGKDIKKLVEELKQNSWTFTYIGTDHDVENIAASLSIGNTLRFEKNEADIKRMFLKEQGARASYSNKIRLKEDTSSNYFDIEEADSDIRQDTSGKIVPPNPKTTFWQRLFGS